ncbi:MAG: hypothetical protein HYU71_02645 [Bacteroidetes bacterium]|nr:hypothetical protein [Bacteroidota bacterium]
MKNMLRLLCIVLLAISSSCTKTLDSKTSGDQITSELQRVISERQLKRVYPVKYNDVFPNFFRPETGTQWTFSNGFIQVNYGLLSTYNLLFLKYYNIHQIDLSDGTTAQALILYF